MRFEQTFQIAAPVETVWGVLSDIERYPEWAAAFQKVEFPAGKTLAKGLAVKLWVKGAPPSTWTVTRFEACRRFAWETTARGVHSVGDHIIEPVGDGTRLTLSIETSGFMARLFAPMIKKVTTRNVGLEGNGLKARAEGMVGG
ncbi:MAG: hypothetical protein C0506_00930 [Anaerolinea sp.]|nr:hypothetical protein [Anaerolinea sp.]